MPRLDGIPFHHQSFGSDAAAARFATLLLETDIACAADWSGCGGNPLHFVRRTIQRFAHKEERLLIRRVVLRLRSCPRLATSGVETSGLAGAVRTELRLGTSAGPLCDCIHERRDLARFAVASGRGAVRNYRKTVSG